jgi:site-specific DNA-methyltransferase (adenine-specific)
LAVKSPLLARERNPDVLTSIANLSNDEVFTPPSFANKMLDTIEDAWAESNNGASIWEDKTVRFLDPFTKSGVFLREIVRRLNEGLTKQIPDQQERVNHILAKQVFGIAITRLTALTARRSVYCSKQANGKHSIATIFDNEEGSIWFKRTEHVWIGGGRKVLTIDENGKEVEKMLGGKCKHCGASQSEYERSEDLETHAYALIHTENPKKLIKEIFGEDMQFDVIIGNPPYQLGSDGGTRDVPIYQKFVQQAKKLDPKLLTMVIPSRWMASGLGLSDFRKQMLSDKRLRMIVDYPLAKDVFTSVEVKGGVCYFLWDSNHDGLCEFTMVRNDETIGPIHRDLSAHDVLVRDSRAIPILEKVTKNTSKSIVDLLSADKEFGWTSNFDDFSKEIISGQIPIYFVRQGKRRVGSIPRDEIKKSPGLIDKYKVLIPKAGSDGGQRLPDVVLGKPLVANSPSVCTQTFLFFYVDSLLEAKSIESYIRTKFFRFLVSLRKITQDATRNTYTWVPLVPLNQDWTDEELYQRFGLTQKEIAYVDSVIKPMEQGDA